MRLRNSLLLFSAILLLSSAVASAQPAPAQPATPAPPAAPPSDVMPAAPATPVAPQAMALLFDGDSFLGIYPEEITRENMARYGLREPRGVAVGKVIANSPAERAGLKENDVILRFEGEEVTGARKLNRLIGEVAPDHTVRLTVRRNGADQEVSVTLGKREDFMSAFELRPGQAAEIWRGLGNDGNAPRAYTWAFGSRRRIGVTTTELTDQLASYFGVRTGHGLLITSVGENSPAAKAGLRAGDVITEVNGKTVENAGDLMREVNSETAGEVTLTIVHDKSPRTIKVRPEKSQAAPFDFTPNVLLPQTIGRVVVMPQIRIQSMPQIKVVVPSAPGATRLMPKVRRIVAPRISEPVI